jgi:hypothetical protein
MIMNPRGKARCPKCGKGALAPCEFQSAADRGDLSEGIDGVHLAVCESCGYETEMVTHAIIRTSLARWQTQVRGHMS